MANSLITPTIIAREALFQLENNLVMGANVHRDYKKEFVKIGSSVSIRRPVRFSANSGATLVKQDVAESNISLTIDQREHVGWGFTTGDLTLTVEKYSERYIEPACIALANKADVYLTGLYPKFWMSAGTPGVTPNQFSILGDAATLLDDGAVPDDGKRKLILNPKTRWTMADALKGIYDNSMPKDLIRKGLLGMLANFSIYGDQNIAVHTNGLLNGTPLVNGANQHSNASPTSITQNLIIDGATASQTDWCKAGDVFTLAGVNSVNPVSKQSTGNLQQFVCTTAVSSDSGGDLTLVIAPAIISTGAYQTVSAVPADDAVMTFLGSGSGQYPQNMAFHKNALALVMCPLELPDSAGFKSRVSKDNTSIRIVKDYGIIDDEEIIRMDILFGADAIYRELGSRIWG